MFTLLFQLTALEKNETESYNTRIKNTDDI